jgi:Na+/H+ antiporter NhaD/arsenite permease-like protein
MQNWQAFVAIITFVGVIGLITVEALNLVVASFLGGLLLVFAQIMTLGEAVDYISDSYNTLALFFGVMVFVRAFAPTGIFDYLATQIVRWSKGRGNRLLLVITGITTIICAVLPNATTVMLLGPLMPGVALAMNVDFVPLLILMVLVSNSAGLLTIIGDPATFIVGTSIRFTFLEYLQNVSLGGLLALATVVCLIPVLFRDIWIKKLEHPEEIPLPELNHKRVVPFGLLLVVGMLVLFVVGESLPIPVSPAAVALLGAGLAMFLSEQYGIETVNHILRDVDWGTLIFFMSVFVLVGGLEQTGVIANLAGVLGVLVGTNIVAGSLALLFVVGLLSSVVPNIPLVVGMIPLLKTYLANVDLVPPSVFLAGSTEAIPEVVLPLFYAMMFGATLGGNGTLVGASANVIAAGIAEQNEQKITFMTFLKYGIPVMICQLLASSVYILSQVKR